MVVALVSGPRTVIMVWPAYRHTTISQWLAACDSNVPDCPPYARQIVSTNDEAEGLRSMSNFTYLAATI
jgi:hypothetical protein